MEVLTSLLRMKSPFALFSNNKQKVHLLERLLQLKAKYGLN